MRIIGAVLIVAIAVAVTSCRSKDAPPKQELAQVSTGDAARTDASSGDATSPTADPVVDGPSPVVGPDKPPPPPPGCATSCDEAEDCPANQCQCEDGKSITARSCINRCCADLDTTCNDTCAKHDGMKGTWNDQREGGKQTGKRCGTDDDCASKECYRGYCTRKCDSWSDCPPFWDCEEVGAAKEELCVNK